MPDPTAKNSSEDEILALIETLKLQRRRRRMAGKSLLVVSVSWALGEASRAFAAPLPFALFLAANAIILQLMITGEAATLHRICACRDTRSLPLIMNLFFESEFPARMYAPVVAALNDTLPKVAPEDREAFTLRHIDLLHNLFTRYHDSKFCAVSVGYNKTYLNYLRLQTTLPEDSCRSIREGALNALAHIGTEETARVLERFIQGKSRSNAQMELQQSARLSLLALKRRLAQENEAKTLLRASQPSEDFLLRPSYAASSEPPETLLRAVQSNANTEKS